MRSSSALMAPGKIGYPAVDFFPSLLKKASRPAPQPDLVPLDHEKKLIPTKKETDLNRAGSDPDKELHYYRSTYVGR